MFGGVKLTDMPVFDLKGTCIGKVEEIFFDPHTGHLLGISVGDFLIATKAIKRITYKITLNIPVDHESYANPWTFAHLQVRELRMH